MLRKALVAVFLAILMAPAPLLAKGPSGSSERGNSVKCGKATGSATPVARVYAGANGVEACSDENTPPDGRIIVDFNKRYASLDGDKSNGSEADGFIRIDQSGPSCGTAKKSDSSARKGGSCAPKLPVPIPVP